MIVNRRALKAVPPRLNSPYLRDFARGFPEHVPRAESSEVVQMGTPEGLDLKRSSSSFIEGYSSFLCAKIDRPRPTEVRIQAQPTSSDKGREVDGSDSGRK